MRLKAPNLFSMVFLAFVFWFVSNIPDWILRSGGPPPVWSYISFLAFASLVILIRASRYQHVFSSEQWAKSKGIWYWLLTFIFWAIFNFLYSSQSPVAFQRFITTLEMAAIFGGFILLLGYWPTSRALGFVLAFLVIMSSSINIYDFFIPTFSTVSGRAAGLYENPTISASLLVLMTTGALYSRKIFGRWVLLSMATVGVFLTFSRGSWVILFITISWLFMKGYLGGYKHRLLIGFLAISSIGAISYLLLSGLLGEYIVNSPLAAYLDSNTLGRIGVGGFATDSSANEREAVVRFAIEKFLNAPSILFGYGMGFTHEWEFKVSTHNMYLFFLVEGGVLGLLMYMSLLAVLWRSAVGIGKLIVLQIIVFSLFTHNFLDSPDRIFFFAFAAMTAQMFQNSAVSGRREAK